MQNRILGYAVAALLLPAAALAQPTILANINTTTRDSNPRSLTKLGDRIVFRASTGWYDDEPWVSDGTAAGTMILRDIIPGSKGSNPDDFTTLNDFVFFTAYLEGAGRSLWKTDGTPAGTTLVDPQPTGLIGDLRNVAGNIFFTAGVNGDYSNGINGPSPYPNELWRTDGTAEGTGRIAIFDRAPKQSYAFGIIATVGDWALFRANDGVNGGALWRTDGTAEGTSLLLDLDASDAPWSGGSDVVSTGRLAFILSYDEELWVTDGTPQGSIRLVEEFSDGYPDNPRVVDGKLRLDVNDGRTMHVWESDGTPEGTKEIDTAGEPVLVLPDNAVSYAGRWLFAAADTEHGEELWQSDGTVAGTRLAVDVVPGTSGSYPADLTVHDGLLYFTTFAPGLFGNELWVTDGTASGTRRLASVERPPSGGGDLYGRAIDSLISTPSQLFFVAEDVTSGSELWRTDGTVTGTVRVRDINDRELGSLLGGIVRLGKIAYFGALDDQYHAGLWRTDGTPAGTWLVRNFAFGVWQRVYSERSLPRTHAVGPPSVYGLQTIGNLLYFRAAEEEDEYELWVSDGTESGTGRLSDIAPGYAGAHSMVTLGSRVLFASGNGLWTGDGTAENTTRLIACDDCSVGKPYVIGAQALVLVAPRNLRAASTVVWSTDGTPEGTRRIADLDERLEVIKGAWSLGSSQVCFVAYVYDGALTHSSLWCTDGSEPGTYGLHRNVGGFGGQTVNGIVFTIAEGDVTTLWRTDGSSAGTVPIAPLDQSPKYEWSSSFVTVGRLAYFTTLDGTADRTLWRTDGTTSGTYPLPTDPTGSGPSSLMEVQGRLWFFVNGEIWESDGTAAGTHPAYGVAAGGVAFAGPVVVLEDRVVLPGSDHRGWEPWSIPLEAPATAWDCNGDFQITVADLVWLVDAALAQSDAAACTGADRNSDGGITVDEVVRAVNDLLAGS